MATSDDHTAAAATTYSSLMTPLTGSAPPLSSSLTSKISLLLPTYLLLCYLSVGGASQIVETQLPLQEPAVEGLYIPSKTRGHFLRMIDLKTAVVRWEYKQSGVVILLPRLAQVLELDGSEEVLVILDLFSRLASFNMAVCFSLMNIRKSLHIQSNYGDSQMESHICSPSHVSKVVMKMDIFDLLQKTSIFNDQNDGLLSRFMVAFWSSCKNALD